MKWLIMSAAVCGCATTQVRTDPCPDAPTFYDSSATNIYVCSTLRSTGEFACISQEAILLKQREDALKEQMKYEAESDPKYWEPLKDPGGRARGLEKLRWGGQENAGNLP